MKIDLNDKVTRFLVQDYVNQICNYRSEEELNFNVHKLIHTFTVVEMAQDLIKLTKPAMSLRLQKQILNAAILHDLGRCHEFRNGVYLKNLDHGKIGADLIKKCFPQMKVEIQSVLYHNKCPSDKDPKFTQPVLDYVRDADMLANIQYEIDHLDIFLMHIIGKNYQKVSKLLIDEEVINAVFEKRPVALCHIKENNLVTGFLSQLCWYYNLKTKSGIKLSKKRNLFIRFKEIICKKIVPLVVSDQKQQNNLVKQIEQIFPNEIFNA